jgi:hypothetical protein
MLALHLPPAIAAALATRVALGTQHLNSAVLASMVSLLVWTTSSNAPESLHAYSRLGNVCIN